MTRFNIDLYPEDPEALDLDCRDLSRHARHLDQWMEVAEIVWRQNGSLMSTLGEYLLKALWPEMRRLSFGEPLGPGLGGEGNWGHLETFLTSSRIISLFTPNLVKTKHSELIQLSGWFYSAACQVLDYRQAIEWVYFGYGERGENAFLLMWSDWSDGGLKVPDQVSPIAIAALKLYRGELIRRRSIGVECWKEKEIKGYHNSLDRNEWEEELERACWEGGGVFEEDEKGLLRPSPNWFELPWWQSITDLSGASGLLTDFQIFKLFYPLSG